MSFDPPLDAPPPGEGIKIPLWASFTGWRGVPMLALGTNNAAPLLRLYGDRVEFKVFRTHTRPLSNIERVDARRIGKTCQVTIEWRGEKLTFAASVHSPQVQRQVLGLFKSRGVALSDAARTLLEER